jgi:hypothetical protein
MVAINEATIKKLEKVQPLGDAKSLVGVCVVAEILRDKAVDTLAALAGTVQLNKAPKAQSLLKRPLEV